MSQITEEQIAEIEGLLAKATPGPWLPSIGGFQVLTGDSWNTICIFHERSGGKWEDHRRAHWEDGEPAKSDEANADLVAALRNAAPALLSAARRGIAAGGADVGALREALTFFVERKNSILNDIKSGHSARANAASDWMREDDREFIRDLRAAFDAAEAALSQPPAPAEGEPNVGALREALGKDVASILDEAIEAFDAILPATPEARS